jgi:hypothetical protein
VRRWLLLPFFVVVGLLVALPGAAAVRDDNANVTLSIVGGQYQVSVENTGDSVINAFTFVPAPTLHITTIASVSAGICQRSGGGFSCSVMMKPPPCMCTPGDTVNVLFNGDGESAGSKVQIGSVIVNATGGGSIAAPVTTPPVVTPPVVTPPKATPKAKPKAKAKPYCKKGQKSTSKKPCRKK